MALYKAKDIWGKLAGYSYDTSVPCVGPYNSIWRKSTWSAKNWMNDGYGSNQSDSNGNGIYEQSSYINRKLAYWTKFDRFYSIDLEHENPSARHYIFILRPDLNLLERADSSKGVTTGGDIILAKDYDGAKPVGGHANVYKGVSKDPYFIYLAKSHPEILASLTGDFAGLSAGKSWKKVQTPTASSSGYGNAQYTDDTSLNGKTLPMHAFIPYLTSRVESLQLPDFNVKSSLITQPYTKYSIPYTQSGIESVTGGTFDITFREDKYYSIHKLFYAWIYYQDRVMRNIFSPKKKYLLYNSLDYATSVYDFLVDETGENILYWVKYTGCVPTAVPMSDLSFNKGGVAETRVSIQFSYFYCEHMDLNAIRDFQYNSLGYAFMQDLGRKATKSQNQFHPCNLSDTEPMFNAADRLGPNLNGRPVIISCPEGSQTVFKLRWLKDNDTSKTIGRASGVHSITGPTINDEFAKSNNSNSQIYRNTVAQPQKPNTNKKKNQFDFIPKEASVVTGLYGPIGKRQ